MADQILGEITLTLTATPEGDQYVSRCLELGTASCGDTAEEALKNLNEAVLVHLNALEDVDELGRSQRRASDERALRAARPAHPL